MKNVAVVYWSGTGNTEAMAQFVAEGVQAGGGTASLIAASAFGADQLDSYDAFAFGCPATGDEELEELEFLPMYDAVEPLLADKPVVLFGSYAWNEGAWMESWNDRAMLAEVNVIGSVIANDYPDDDVAAECKRLGSLLAE